MSQASKCEKRTFVCHEMGLKVQMMYEADNNLYKTSKQICLKL